MIRAAFLALAISASPATGGEEKMTIEKCTGTTAIVSMMEEAKAKGIPLAEILSGFPDNPAIQLMAVAVWSGKINSGEFLMACLADAEGER